jgi:hypothetical protein
VIEGQCIGQPQRIINGGYGISWRWQDAERSVRWITVTKAPPLSVETPEPAVGDSIEYDEPA